MVPTASRSRVVVLVLLLLVHVVLVGCTSGPATEPEWWDSSATRQPAPGESLSRAGLQVGTVLLIAGGVVTLGLLTLWFASMDDDGIDQETGLPQ